MGLGLRGQWWSSQGTCTSGPSQLVLVWTRQQAFEGEWETDLHCLLWLLTALPLFWQEGQHLLIIDAMDSQSGRWKWFTGSWKPGPQVSHLLHRRRWAWGQAQEQGGAGVPASLGANWHWVQRQLSCVSTCLSHTWVYPALQGHYGGRGSSLEPGPESPWPSLRGCQVPLHGQSSAVGAEGGPGAGREVRSGKGWAWGALCYCLDTQPPAVSSGLAVGQEGRVGQARRHKGFLWLYCCLALFPPLLGCPTAWPQAVLAPQSQTPATPTPWSSPAPGLLETTFL